MQIVPNGDSLHRMSNHVSGKNKINIITLSSAESDQRVGKVIIIIIIIINIIDIIIIIISSSSNSSGSNYYNYYYYYSETY